MERIAICMSNYNMPERADAMADAIEKYVHWPHDLFMCDNASDIMPPARNTTVWLEHNLQTTGGLYAALAQADNAEMVGKFKYLAYVFTCTSAEYVGTDDIIMPMALFLLHNDNAVGVHPSLIRDSTTSWKQLIDHETGGPREVSFIDSVFGMYRADWFNSIGRYDPELTYCHGTDLETCYIARKQGRSLWVLDSIHVKKISDIGYVMGRMGMTAEQRRINARAEMNRVLKPRYGPGYWDDLQHHYWDHRKDTLYAKSGKSI